MASNHFGNIFKITTWGESHGIGIGVVIDGCPSGVPISEEEINQVLAKRAPGRNDLLTPRKEKDLCRILSGVFKGYTTGAPISIMIDNHDCDSTKYHGLSNVLRPGHANYTYLSKYGIFDYYGGGRASARETASRVAAGAIARKFINQQASISILAYISGIGDVTIQPQDYQIKHDVLRSMVQQSAVYCPDKKQTNLMESYIKKAKATGDSLGGKVAFDIENLPIGLGDPVYEKISARLAYAMFSIPAVKGFELGEGFFASTMRGSMHNDPFEGSKKQPRLISNHAGGILGGISSGEHLYGNVAFKPTSSIMKKQMSFDLKQKQTTEFNLPPGSRHDPCVAIRAVPVVEAMCALVIADFILLNRTTKSYESFQL